MRASTSIGRHPRIIKHLLGRNIPVTPVIINRLLVTPSKSIDHRLGSPSVSAVPLNAFIGLISKKLDQERDCDYAKGNIAPESTRAAVAHDHTKTYKSGSDITAKNVFVHGGATLPATMVAQSLIFKERDKAKEEGREAKPVKALSLAPYYGLYLEANDTLGIQNKVIQSTDPSDEKEVLNNIKKALGETDPEQPVSLTIINPNNPTGHIYSRAFMEGLLKLAEEHDNLNLVQDSVYDHIIPSEDGIAQNKDLISLFKEAPDTLKDRIFEVNSLSKSTSYPGLRAGWVVMSEENVEKFADKFDPLYGQLSADTYLIIESVLSPKLPKDEQMDKKYYSEMNKVYYNKIKFLQEAMQSISKEGATINAPMPDGGFYLWADLKPLTGGNSKDADMLVKEFVKRAKAGDPEILLKDGATAGGAGHIRFNGAAQSDDLQIIADSLIKIAEEMGYDINETGRTTKLVSEAEIREGAYDNSGQYQRDMKKMREEFEALRQLKRATLH